MLRVRLALDEVQWALERPATIKLLAVPRQLVRKPASWHCVMNAIFSS